MIYLDTCLKHLMGPSNDLLTHLHHVLSNPFITKKFDSMCWVTCICHELDKFILFNHIEGLVTGHNPFGEKAFEFGLIPWTLVHRVH
jgi:hypothetical protein